MKIFSSMDPMGHGFHDKNPPCFLAWWHAIMLGGCDPYSWVSVAEHQWGRGWEQNNTKKASKVYRFTFDSRCFGTVLGCFSLGLALCVAILYICHGEIFPGQSIYDSCFTKRQVERSVKKCTDYPNMWHRSTKTRYFSNGPHLVWVYQIPRDPIAHLHWEWFHGTPKFDLRFGGDWSNTPCSSSDVRWLDSYCLWFRNPASTSWGW